MAVKKEEAREHCCTLGLHETEWHDDFLKTFTLSKFTPKDVADLVAGFGEIGDPLDFTDLLFAHKEELPDPDATKTVYNYVCHWLRVDQERARVAS